MLEPKCHEVHIRRHPFSSNGACVKPVYVHKVSHEPLKVNVTLKMSVDFCVVSLSPIEIIFTFLGDCQLLVNN